MNDVCAKNGHYWISTTADNYKMCSRNGCYCVQKRDFNDKWEIVIVKRQNYKISKKSYLNAKYSNLRLFI